MSTREIAKFTLEIQHHCAWAQALVLTNDDGSRFDFSAGTLSCQIRETASYTATPLATPTVTVTNATLGECTISQSAHDAALLPVGDYAKTFTRKTRMFGEINFIPNADPLNPIRLAEIDVRVSSGGNHNPATAAAPTVALETVSLLVGGASPATTLALLGLSGPHTLDGGTDTTDFTGADVLDGGDDDTDFTNADTLDGGTT